jgi:hypothetical protein
MTSNPRAQIRAAARPHRWLTPVLFAAVAGLSACGGGSDSPPPAAPATEGRQAAQAVGNADVSGPGDFTLDASSAEVDAGSRFETREGYLAKGASVLRGASGATARFEPRLPRAGQYEVLAWWPQNLSDGGEIDITVTHRDGQSLIRKDQRRSGGQWVSLGSFAFDAAGGPKGPAVTFTSTGGTPLYVDTVRFVLQPSALALSVATEKLAIGLKNEAYIAEVEASGGLPPLSFSLADGQLPPGLRLDPQQGVISGTAQQAGDYAFSITVRDARGRTATRGLSIFVDESAGVASQAAGMALGSAAPPERQRALSAGAAKADAAASTDSTGDLSGLLGIVSSMPEGDWRRVNLNDYSQVWTPAALRPLFGLSNPDPSRIILAWSSFAWDPNRAALILYGGGHANYRGNDTYIWRASTRMWERASLPSEMVQTSLGYWNAIDGVANAPASAHTYDNTIFLPILDRMAVFGGAADPNGGHFITQTPAGTARNTGPYLYDPSRAHPDRVGGSTGSHVKRVAPYPDVVGSNIWQNRESWLAPAAGSMPPTEVLSNGCTGYAVENGRDIVYLRSASRLYRYTINDLNTPGADTWARVGQFYYAGSGTQSTCGYDPARKIFLSTNTVAKPFIYWNLNTPASTNRDVIVTPSDPTGEFPTLLSSGNINLGKCGMEFDPLRGGNFKLWCGDGRVWTLTPPATMGASGWVITKAPAPVGAVPSDSLGTGILGKWKYVPNLDVFIALSDAVKGNVWIYKPHGWVNPGGPVGNVAPSVSITSPAPGAQFTLPTDITVSADASDSDGSVAKVEFFADSVKIGERLTAPWSIDWSGATAGTRVLTAVATDDLGATQTSMSVSISVLPPAQNQPPSVALTQPANGSTINEGTPISVQADASDDGSVAQVEFFANGNSLGVVTSAPYAVNWANAPLGQHTLVAVATDDLGLTTTSAARTVTVVTPGSSTTVTLQRGTAGSVVADTYLSSYGKTTVYGLQTRVQDQSAYYPSLLRFAVFQSEGGPVPNGAQVTSAVLSLYKYTAYNMNYGVHRVLVDWTETGATWNQRLPGVPWSTAGAGSLGADVAAAADATAAIEWSPGWIGFDVTASVQQMSGGSTANFGWRLIGAGGYTAGLKQFYSSEWSTPALRPKLVVTYQ